MSLVTVEGTFKNGTVDLAEVPTGVDRARVLVTFLPSKAEDPPRQMMKLGQFSGPPDRTSTEEDFTLAEWWRGKDR